VGTRVRAGCALTIVAVAVSGCGRIDFEPRADGGGSADNTCWPSWRAHAVAPTVNVVPELMIGGDYLDPALTKDALGMYFASTKASSVFQLYFATRTDRTQAWSMPLAVTEFVSTHDEEKLSVTADGLLGVHASNPGSEFQLYTSERASTTDPFGPRDNSLLANVDDQMYTFDPDLSADGLVLYYAPGSGMTQTIDRSTRASRDDPFGVAQLVLQATTGQISLADPTVSPDELVIVATISTASDPGILAYSTRASTSDAFGALVPIPGLNTAAQEGNGELSFDGCELFFTRDLMSIDVATVR
jgi:hypothetical protein